MINALLVCPSEAAACTAAKVSRTSLFRWKKQAQFIDALDGACKLARGYALAIAQARVGKVFSELYYLATSRNIADYVRRPACSDFLTHIERFSDELLDDHDVRIVSVKMPLQVNLSAKKSPSPEENITEPEPGVPAPGDDDFLHANTDIEDEDDDFSFD